MAKDGIGDQAMDEETLKQAKRMRVGKCDENCLVNLFTPALIEIVKAANPDLRLVNSEYYSWLQCDSDPSSSCLRPDLFSAHYALIEYREPYKNGSSCIANRLFGKFADWKSRASINCIWDAKWNVTNEGFGSIFNYLHSAGRECRTSQGVVPILKGIVFDIEDFHMIQSESGKITEIVSCKWSQPGSKQHLIEFLSENNEWCQAVHDICEQMKVTIKDYSMAERPEGTAMLGSGAFGRVFQLDNDDQALKIVFGENYTDVEAEFNSMMAHYENAETQSLVFPPVKDSYREGKVGDMYYAGYLLAKVGTRITLFASNDEKKKLAELLFTLHSKGVIHGDPRVQNVLVLDGALKFIDFRSSGMHCNTFNREDDVGILFQSLGGSKENYSYEIREYAKNPTLEDLEKLLLQAP